MPRARVYWIRLEDGVHDHPKTIAAAERLGISRERLVGHLTRFWMWLSRYRPNGILKDLSDPVIAEAAGWRGDAGAFVEALREVRFISGASRRPVAHGWAEHNGRQIREAERKARNRAAERRGKNQFMRGHNAPGSAYATQRNATDEAGMSLSQPQAKPERGNGRDRGREILSDPASVRKAEEYIAEIWELSREVPKLAHLQPYIKKLEPVGVYKDSKRSVLRAPRTARDRLKANPEFATVQILLKR